MSATPPTADQPSMTQPSTTQPSTTAAGQPTATGRAADTSGWVRRLWRYMLRHRRNLVIALGAAILGSTCQTLTPLVARQIVDGVVVAKTQQLWPWLVLLVALSAAAFGFAYLRRYRGGRVALEVQTDLRNDMHDHLQAMDLTNLDRMPTGQLVARANSDSTLVQMLLSFLPIVSGNVIMLVLSLVVMLFLSPLLALVSLVIVPALLVISYRMRTRVFPASWDGQQREGDLAQIVDEDVGGVRVVKAFGQERRELERLAASAGVLYGSQMRAVRIQSRFQPLLEAVPAIGQVAILALGGWLALNNAITLGTFLAFSAYVAQLMAPARQLAGILTIGQQARAGVERIFQLLDLTPAITDAPGAVDLPAGVGQPAVRGAEIEFADVQFTYAGGAPALGGFNLHLAPGERVALVGASGSGKSTAAMLVSRFYDPQGGAVLVDGHDVRGLTRHSLRQQIGVVFEESFLFSDSVRSNIAYGRPDASDADIEAAARAAQAHEFIQALPHGYKTVVGERGLSLSGGQRQRIALARAILKSPRILVLDDATSAIDAKTEEHIHDALRDVLAERTVLLVAHRQSTLQLADRVVLLDHGVAVDTGSHSELMERNAAYRLLLSGLGDDLDDEADDSIESLAALAADRESAPAAASAGQTASEQAREPTGTTASAWNGADGDAPRSASRSVGGPSLGPGLGGSGGGGGSWRLGLAPTPELLAKVAALQPVKDFPTVDLDAEAAHRGTFTLGAVLREFRRPLLIGLILVVLDALAGLAGPVLVKTGIDDGVATGSAAVLFAASGIYLMVVLADLLTEIGETFVTGRVAQRVMLSLRIRIFAQLQRLSLDYYEREMAGRIMTRMTTDVDQFESLIQNGLLNALVSIVTFAGVGVTLVLVSAELGLWVLSVIIPLAIATMIFRGKAARLYELSRERIAVVNADFQESLSGVRESQAFVHEAATEQRFHGLGDRYLESRVAAQRLVAVYFPFVQFLSGVADAIVLGVGATLIVSGQLTTGALIAFMLYIDMFFSPIQQLSQVFDSWQQTRVSVRRISDLMRLETLTPEVDDARDPGRLTGRIGIDDVHFAYPVPADARRIGAGELRGPRDAHLALSADAGFVRAPEALKGIDLQIEPGETVALVGETGAGKSTVMKLLARFYDPDSGRAHVDAGDLRTLDLRDLDLRAFRVQLGYVPQEAFLFTGRIRDNIAYGRPDASDGAVEAAARAVGAHDFIAELSGGYLHELSERGRSLSAGQRQLIALARAELVDPVLLLLDEATSNLDLATEARVSAAMQRVARGRTTVVIAHRLQTAQAADRIIVLDHGTIAEVGSHDELLARGGRYAAMWDAFASVGQPR
ncbi:ABC transporter ATP-binding protein [Rathayibacter soli]|uniref:ABC transporter ATP-binding protein n=1 Tax=Rathayibacter soli TaxID=3144168 RepID=UPI0027E4B42C|nr:ABC transporter ATP-binding protein [Glaciibacter superstes]